MDSALQDLDTGDTLAGLEAALLAKRTAEADILILACHWADQHPDQGIRAGATRAHAPGAERGVRMGGEGTPMVAEFAPAELAISLQIHPLAGRHLIADALDLRHRLPRLWHRTTNDLAVPDWVARKIAKATRHLPAAQAEAIDEELAPVLATLPPARLLDKVDALVIAADTTTADQDRDDAMATRFVTFNTSNQRGLKGLYAKLSAADAITGDAQIDRLAHILGTHGDTDTLAVRRSKALGILISNPAHALQTILGPDRAAVPPEKLAPSVVLHLHLTDHLLTSPDARGVARLETTGNIPGGPITLAHAIEILGHANLTIRPVRDLTDQIPADAYEFTGHNRDAVHLRTPADCYPHAVSVSRKMDIDHTLAYNPHGPPGQTHPANAGPMVRHHHRIKTHGPITVRQPSPGSFVWQTPHQRYRLTNHRGTHQVTATIGRAIHGNSPPEAKLATLLLPV